MAYMLNLIKSKCIRLLSFIRKHKIVTCCLCGDFMFRKNAHPVYEVISGKRFMYCSECYYNDIRSAAGG
jgi:hypothetical protein